VALIHSGGQVEDCWWTAGLNLYATHPGAFTNQSTATGSMFAADASMALLAAARHDTTNHLIRGLETTGKSGPRWAF
jgi:hypothetical protein